MPKNTTSYPDLNALADFSAKWNALHPTLAEKLRAFFQKWPHYNPKEYQTSEQPSIAYDRVFSLTDFFGSFPSAMKAMKRQGHRLNIWEIAGVGKDELRNMAILFWWLRQDGEHDLGKTILNGIMKTIKKEYGESPIHKITDFTDDYQIHREHTLWDQQGRACRLDIIIESKDVLIVIEGKINAPESINVNDGEVQLDRYCDLARARSGKKQWAVVYLTPSKRLDESRRKKHPELFEITWKEIANVIRKESKKIEKGKVIRALLESTSNAYITF